MYWKYEFLWDTRKLTQDSLDGKKTAPDHGLSYDGPFSLLLPKSLSINEILDLKKLPKKESFELYNFLCITFEFIQWIQNLYECLFETNCTNIYLELVPFLQLLWIRKRNTINANKWFSVHFTLPVRTWCFRKRYRLKTMSLYYAKGISFPNCF